MLDGHTGALVDTLNTDGPLPLCDEGSAANNIKWYRFLVCEQYVELLITPSLCTDVNSNGNMLTGLQAGIYDDCNYANLLACSSDGNTSAFTLAGNQFTPGELVYLFLDGNGGSVCNYQIDIVAGIDTSDIDFESDSLDMPEDGMVMGPDTLCTNSTGVYNFSLPTCIGMGTISGCLYNNLYEQNLICYDWKIEPDTGYVFIGDSTAAEITLEWTIPGTYVVDVEVHIDPALQACSSGVFECGQLLPLPVVVIPPEYINLPTIYVCRGETYQYCGEIYTNDVTAYCEIDSCTFEVQPIIFLDPVYNFIGTHFTCSGSDCFYLNGVEYCNPGYYSIQNQNTQCEEYDEFEIIDLLDVSLNVISSNDINCVDQYSSLTSNMNIDLQNFQGEIIYTWTDDYGNQIGNSSSIDVNIGGNYNCYISFPEYDHLCSLQSSAYVSQDIEEVIATLDYDDINCESSFSTINYIANKNIIAHQWEGENGFYSTSANPTITAGGIYQVILTADNGCEYIEEFSVEENISPPICSLGNTDYWKCDTETMLIRVDTPSNDMIVEWQTNNGNITGESPSQIEISQPGTYTVSITDPTNFCTTILTTTIVNDPEMFTDFTLSVTPVFCYGADDGNFSIGNITGGVPPFTTYVNGIVSQELFFDQLVPGTYEVILTDAEGCEITKTIDVVEYPENIITSTLEADVIYDTDQVLSVTISEHTQIASIIWTDTNETVLGEGTDITVHLLEDTNITITATDIYNCKVSVDIFVKISLADNVYIPNIFSPNEDGVNDYFTIYSVHSPGKIVDLHIYDRWGNMVFFAEGSDINNEEKGWNGTLNGKPLPSAIYVYRATINNGNGSLKNIHGSVTLVR